ncbi:MAG TPA: ABC transporter substrate-binding protein [Pseudorhodoplanes sp.]|nr:ABC transporter substrate-binding protein [Pseudorhodoplanes sp.]
MRNKTVMLGLVAAIMATTAAQAQDKVTFRLNWLMYGFHTPFYLGLERGYYKDEGIELTIGEGQGSVRAVQTVGAKGDMFGLADGGSVLAGVAKGAPVKAVMAVTNSSPYSLAVRTDAGVKTLKDIEGKTVATAPGEAGLQLLPGLFARNGVDIDKVKILRVEGSGKMVAVAEKRAEALMAGLDNQSLTLPRQGTPLIDFAYSKYGTNTVGLTIFTHNDLIRDNPGLVRRFVKATVRSFEAAIKEPEAAIKAGQKVKPDLETDLSLQQLKVGIGLMKTPATEKLPTGYFAAKDWEDTLDLMKKYMALETSMKADEFFTNDFLPK